MHFLLSLGSPENCLEVGREDVLPQLEVACVDGVVVSARCQGMLADFSICALSVLKLERPQGGISLE